MINAQTREYNYYTIGEDNGYGQPQMPAADAQPVGKIKLAIYLTSQAIQDNVNYKNCNYIALTRAKVDDTYVIEYEGARLKVLYVNTDGRYKQVYLQKL